MRRVDLEDPVSAVSASSTAAGSASADPVRALQHTLYRAAKADPGRRFHALRDKVYRRDVLERAWVTVRRNNGAPGIDATTLADVEEYGVPRLLDELAAELRDGRYRPCPARRVSIPKPGTAERRPLSIPTVRDRVAQAATKIVLEPVFEADFVPCSFGSARDDHRTTLCRSSSMRPGEVGGGWSRRISPTASRRFRTMR